MFSSSTAITRLKLQNAGIADGSLVALAGLPKLEHLCFHNSRLYASLNLGTVSAFAWATLKHLTRLDLSIPVPAESLRDLSSMTRLRVLEVDDVDCSLLVTAAPGVALPPSLQHFNFYGVLGPSVGSSNTFDVSKLGRGYY